MSSFTATAGPGGSPEPIVILMATHNGERFLKEQLSSLRSQTEENWRLLVADDCSADSTLALLEEESRADPRIEIVDTGIELTGARGAAETFGLLIDIALQYPAAAYFFADQDDRWDEEKLATLNGLLQDSRTNDVPLLVFSDMRIIDELGNSLAGSFVRERHFPVYSDRPVLQLLSTNYVTGCSLCINRPLLEIASPMPPGSLMHDWWLALIAAVVGEIRYCSRTLVDYRQHSGNAIGSAGESQLLSTVSSWRRLWEGGQDGLLRSFSLAEKVKLRAAESGIEAAENLDALSYYSSIPQAKRLARIGMAKELELRRGRLLLRLVLYLRLLLL